MCSCTVVNSNFVRNQQFSFPFSKKNPTIPKRITNNEKRDISSIRAGQDIIATTLDQFPVCFNQIPSVEILLLIETSPLFC